jgi:ABC-type transport system involved in cytochrome bd biosynthesis fused ATPase/permease subunit
VLGFFAPIDYLVQRRVRGREDVRDPLGTALRQGVLAAIFVVTCVWLAMIRALSWMNALLLLAFLVLIELFMLARE